MNSNDTNTESQPSAIPSVNLIDGTGKLTDFHCPRCPEQQLEVGTIFKFQVCHCRQCSGFVVDSPTLGLIIRTLRSAYGGPELTPRLLNPNELQSQTSCPTCFETMATHPYHGPGNVVLDSCQACCLTWLDNDELNSIMRAPGLR